MSQLPKPKRVFRLTGRLGDLATYMVQRRGEVVFVPDLLSNVFGHPLDSPSRTVDTHVYRLTKVVGDSEEIFSVNSRRRRGYMLGPPPGERPITPGHPPGKTKRKS